MNKTHQKPVLPDATQRIEKAEARIEKAEARLEQAELRTEQAETRTEQAMTRIGFAETRAEQAETRTEFAKTRAEEAEVRTGKAETRAEQAESVLESFVQVETGEALPKSLISDESEDQRALHRLTPRQREVFEFIARGENTKQIGSLLKISPKTVEYHRTRLMRELNVHDVTALVRLALRIGLIPYER